jgi:hypothetical protein
MGAALWAAARWLGPWFDAGIWLRLAGLASLVGGGLALYGGLAYGLHALDHAALRALFKRRGGGASGDDITGPPA